MNPDQNNSRLPARRDSDDAQIQSETDAPAVMGFLPQTDTIDEDERIPIAREEGYDPLAIQLALATPASSAADKLRLFIFILVAAALVIFLFPLNRFFKPAPRDLGPMSIGGPILEESLTSANIRQKPWLATLVEMDRLYFQEGKLTDAIRLAESELEKLTDKDREPWRRVYYRYWELLLAAGKVHVLKTSTRAYLSPFPEDPFANYYFSRAFLTDADRIRSFSPETKAAYRQEAISIASQIDRAGNALKARRQHADTKKSESAVFADLFRKLRLEQARLYVLIWKLSGYEEDEHPDVIYRDRALDICDSGELFDMKEAKELKATIYTHIIDRWYWFEGRQIIQNHQIKRKDLQNQLDTLFQELKNAEKL
jgi:hypothetical protein